MLIIRLLYASRQLNNLSYFYCISAIEKIRKYFSSLHPVKVKVRSRYRVKFELIALAYRVGFTVTIQLHKVHPPTS